MDAMTENTIRQEQVGSFGQMVAGFSHDMKNHLGIIRESNGLMSDVIAMGGLSDDEASVERFKKSIDAIERRVAHVAKMLHHLSGFAHRPDTPYSSFQINDLIAEVIMLFERFSRLKQIDLALELEEGLPSVYNDPSLLQHVLYRVYILCLEQLNAGHNLGIITGQDEKIVVVTFRLSNTSQTSLNTLFDENLQAAVKKLEGTLETGEAIHDHADVKLVIPSLSAEK